MVPAASKASPESDAGGAQSWRARARGPSGEAHGLTEEIAPCRIQRVARNEVARLLAINAQHAVAQDDLQQAVVRKLQAQSRLAL